MFVTIKSQQFLYLPWGTSKVEITSVIYGLALCSIQSCFHFCSIPVIILLGFDLPWATNDFSDFFQNVWKFECVPEKEKHKVVNSSGLIQKLSCIGPRFRYCRAYWETCLLICVGLWYSEILLLKDSALYFTETSGLKFC